MANLLLSIIKDDKIFSYVILFLYVCNSARQAYEGKWLLCWYWLAAFQITTSATWGMNK